MAFSRPAPLLEELQRALPDRPFEVAFWDGSTLPSTNGAWTTASIPVAGSQSIQIQFEAADAGTASLVEAGVDDVKIL